MKRQTTNKEEDDRAEGVHAKKEETYRDNNDEHAENLKATIKDRSVWQRKNKFCFVTLPLVYVFRHKSASESCRKVANFCVLVACTGNLLTVLSKRYLRFLCLFSKRLDMNCAMKKANFVN